MFERCALFNCLERFKKNDKGRAERRNENGLTNTLRSIAKELNISLGKVQRVLKK